MSSTEVGLETAEAGSTCGNCGARVPSDAVTCPACGVLLAAYLTTTGSAQGMQAESDTSATHTVPSADAGTLASSEPALAPEPPPNPAAGPPVEHHPRSQSPIGDALRASHDATTAQFGGHDTPAVDPVAELTRMAAAQQELSGMADGEDELADMASGEDELARMASGRDELADMAREGSVPLEDVVNAELAGARVVFEGNQPVIEANEVEVIDPGSSDPEVIEHPPASPPTTPKAAPARTSRPVPEDRGHQQSTMQQATPSAAAPAGRPHPIQPTSKVHSVALVLPFLLVICMVMSVGRSGGSFIVVSGFLVVGVIYLLLRIAGKTGRKTTSLLSDNFWDQRR